MKLMTDSAWKVEREAIAQELGAQYQKEFWAKEAELLKKMSDKEAEMDEKLAGKEALLDKKMSDKEAEMDEKLAGKEALLDKKMSDKEAEMDEKLAGKEALLDKKMSDKEAEMDKNLSSKKDELDREANSLAATKSVLDSLSLKEKSSREILSKLANDKTSLENQINDFQTQLACFRHDVRFDLAEVGHYRPRYDFEESREYDSKIKEIESRLAALISNKEACVCDKEWTIGGSKSEGKKTTNAINKLMLRAFNGESDAVIAKVRFGNLAAFESRINSSFTAINKLGSNFACHITGEYLDLKIQELHLVYGYNEKLHDEKEEQRAIREKMKEEEKAQKEIEKAEREAEEEEQRYQSALDRARQELSLASDSKKKELIDRITDLEGKLQDAIDKGQRAMSMAQQTKKGHVYIVSNEGSFGEDIYKIGGSRRLNPFDRVDELGGASVPFRFDVHAMIATDDMPALEHALHKALDHKRVNKVNKRKEFFNATLSEIAEIAKAHHGEFSMTLLAEAREYRKSLTMNVSKE
jgi:hypothetical protein